MTGRLRRLKFNLNSKKSDQGRELIPRNDKEGRGKQMLIKKFQLHLSQLVARMKILM